MSFDKGPKTAALVDLAKRLSSDGRPNTVEETWAVRALTVESIAEQINEMVSQLTALMYLSKQVRVVGVLVLTISHPPDTHPEQVWSAIRSNLGESREGLEVSSKLAAFQPFRVQLQRNRYILEEVSAELDRRVANTISGWDILKPDKLLTPQKPAPTIQSPRKPPIEPVALNKASLRSRQWVDLHLQLAAERLGEGELSAACSAWIIDINEAIDEAEATLPD